MKTSEKKQLNVSSSTLILRAPHAFEHTPHRCETATYSAFL